PGRRRRTPLGPPAVIVAYRALQRALEGPERDDNREKEGESARSGVAGRAALPGQGREPGTASGPVAGVGPGGPGAAHHRVPRCRSRRSGGQSVPSWAPLARGVRAAGGAGSGDRSGLVQPPGSPAAPQVPAERARGPLLAPPPPSGNGRNRGGGDRV